MTSEAISMHDDPDDRDDSAWHDSRTLVLAWLLFFFPVGLYGLWKGRHDSRVMITGIVVVLFLVLGGTSFGDVLYVFVLCPIGMVLLWRDDAIGNRAKYGFGAALALLVLLYLAQPAARQSGAGGGCASVSESGGCTYYRDSNCNVIARECE